MARDPNDPTWIVDWWKLGGILTVIVASVYLHGMLKPIVTSHVEAPLRSLTGSQAPAR